MTRDELRFDGEVVLVAGGGGALGGAYAHLFAARGASVIVNDIGDGAKTVAQNIRARGGTALAVIASAVTESPAIVQAALDGFGRLDVVVSSAGLTNGGLFQTIPADEWTRAFDSHLTATLELARAAWPHLSASGNGRLINTSSTSIFGTEYVTTYITAKGAIFALGKALALEGRTQNVRVNTIMPHAYSQMTAQMPDPKGVEIRRRNFQPEKVAGFVAWLAHRSTTVTGQCFEAGGGRAAHIYLAEAAPVLVDDPTVPEAWAGYVDALTSTVTRHVPESMAEEARLRWQSLGLPVKPDKVLGD